MTDDYAPLPYDDGLTDDAPQIAVVMSSGWWAYVRGAFERLLSLETWDTADDADAAVSQAFDAMARLIGGDVMGIISFPASIWVDIRGMTWKAYSARTWASVPTAAGAGYFYPLTPIINDPIVEFVVFLTPGSYALQWLVRRESAQGKFKWLLNGADTMSGGQFDCYNASEQIDYSFQATFNVDIPGEYTIRLQNNGKHASSTGYYINLNGAALLRL